MSAYRSWRVRPLRKKPCCIEALEEDSWRAEYKSIVGRSYVKLKHNHLINRVQFSGYIEV
jgi:hypothetical protein